MKIVNILNQVSWGILPLSLLFLSCTSSPKATSDANNASNKLLTGPAPSPTSQPTPFDIPPTAKEQALAYKRISEDIPLSVDDVREMLANLEAIANSKDWRSKGVKPQLPIFRQHVERLRAAQTSESAKLCNERKEEALTAIKSYLADALHDPSSLQDLRVSKCVPFGVESTILTHVRISYRAKNTFGALVLNEDVLSIFFSNSNDKLSIVPYSALASKE